MTKIKLDLDRLAADVLKDNVFGRRYDSYLVITNNINYDFQCRLDFIMPNGKLEIDKNTDELVYILTTSGVIPPKFVMFRYNLKKYILLPKIPEPKRSTKDYPSYWNF